MSPQLLEPPLCGNSCLLSVNTCLLRFSTLLCAVPRPLATSRPCCLLDGIGAGCSLAIWLLIPAVTNRAMWSELGSYDLPCSWWHQSLSLALQQPVHSVMPHAAHDPLSFPVVDSVRLTVDHEVLGKDQTLCSCMAFGVNVGFRRSALLK